MQPPLRELTIYLQTFFSDADPSTKIAALKKACEAHVKLTKECSKGMGHDRHLYALYCLYQRELAKPDSSTTELPAIFTDPGYTTATTTILSTSNCGNPALRLFGFAPVSPFGFGIGYIIRSHSISICASSKHLQTRRWLDTLERYLSDVQRLIVGIHQKANTRAKPWVDHRGVMRDSKTGAPVDGIGAYEQGGAEEGGDDGLGEAPYCNI